MYIHFVRKIIKVMQNEIIHGEFAYVLCQLDSS